MADATLLNADDDLGKLVTVLNPLAGYWVAIAAQLGMTSQVVNVETNRRNVGSPDFLREVLTRWLSQENPSPTLEALCRALRADTEIIGGGNAARQLEETFTSRRAPTSRITGHPTAPHVMSPTLQAGSQNPVVPAAHQILQTHSVHPIKEDSGAVAVARENRHIINWKFGVLLKKSCKKLREKNLNVYDFRLFLKGLFPPGDCVPESSNVEEIFDAITRNKLWDHWNCSPLQKVVQEFVGDDQEMKSCFETYKKDLKAYKATTKLVDYITMVPSSDDSSSDEDQEQAPAKYDRRYYHKLSIKLEAKFTSHTLEYLDDLWKEFADLYNLPPLVTLLDCICESSILIVWLVPAHLAHHILRAAPDSVDIFRKHQITRVEFDGVCIYPEAKQHSQDAAFPLTAEQEAAVVDIGVTDLQCGSYHFSQQEDAPSRFLPRAFPGLQESVQERTQDLSREYQPPPQLFQSKGFHHVTYNILSYLDDARSLCRAEQVCSEWYRVIAVELLWKKLIERKVKTDPVWRGLSQRRGWDKYLFRRVPPSEGITHEFYRQLYPNIVRDINNLQINWKNGHHTLTRIECGEKTKGSRVICLQYDNKRIISGHEDNTIKIWDRKSLKCSTVLQGHTGSVQCLQYDDRVIITGSEDSTIRVWDMNDGSMLNKLVHHRGAVYDLKFNSDTMVTGSTDGTVAVWDMMSPMDIFLRKELKGHRRTVYTVDFDEKYIVSGSWDRTIKVWRTSNGECVRTLHGHTVYCLQYRGNHIVSGSYDHTIRIWDIESGACLKILEGHNRDVWCIRFDDKRIVSGGYDFEIKVWDFQAALDPRSQADTLCLQTLRGHSGGVYSHGDFQVVSGSYDATILIWDFLDPVPPGPIDTDQSDNKKALT